MFRALLCWYRVKSSKSRLRWLYNPHLQADLNEPRAFVWAQPGKASTGAHSDSSRRLRLLACTAREHYCGNQFCSSSSRWPNICRLRQMLSRWSPWGIRAYRVPINGSLYNENQRLLVFQPKDSPSDVLCPLLELRRKAWISIPDGNL